jgi:hypothetical protein
VQLISFCFTSDDFSPHIFQIVWLCWSLSIFKCLIFILNWIGIFLKNFSIDYAALAHILYHHELFDKSKIELDSLPPSQLSFCKFSSGLFLFNGLYRNAFLEISFGGIALLDIVSWGFQNDAVNWSICTMSESLFLVITYSSQGSLKSTHHF